MNPIQHWMDKVIVSPMALSMLNTITKYPSIPTYHAIGDKGRLTEALNVEFGADLLVTEKIDGTNARVIFTPAGFLLGSREHLLYAEGDLIGDPAMGIVNHLRSFAEEVSKMYGPVEENHIAVLWGELYGGNVTANSKQYTLAGRTDFRAFDFASIDLRSLSGLSQSEISGRRERGELMKFHPVPVPLKVVPSLGNTPTPPTGLEETQEWLRRVMPKSLAALDERAGAIPEGVVVRNSDRTKIAKIRFEDYARTLKNKGDRK